MKKIENNFTVSGFVGKDAEIRQFANASVARFSLAVGRQEKNGEETNRVSAFMNMEAWRKNEHTESFDKLTKGTLLTVEGFFKPEEWTDKDGVKHSRIIMVATKFYECPDKEETPAEEPAKPATKKGKEAIRMQQTGALLWLYAWRNEAGNPTLQLYHQKSEEHEH